MTVVAQVVLAVALFPLFVGVVCCAGFVVYVLVFLPWATLIGRLRRRKAEEMTRFYIQGDLRK